MGLGVGASEGNNDTVGLPDTVTDGTGLGTCDGTREGSSDGSVLGAPD